MVSFRELGLCNTKKMFKIALDKHFAVPGYNVSNLEQFQAVIMGCGQTNSPVILQINPTSLRYANQIMLRHITKGCVEMAENLGYQIPISLHLDHGDNFELCKSCIENGFSSVMIDGSHLSYEENIRITKQVVEYAKEKDVSVEAELGIVGRPDKNDIRDHLQFTDPDKAKEFINRTGCDSLAIAIGTSHGAYKFNVERASDVPELRFDILQKIQKMIGKKPLVLHGASSILSEIINVINLNGGSINQAFGVPEAQLRKASQIGICKINIATDNRLLFTAIVRKYLRDHPDHFDPRQYLGSARDAITDMVKRKNQEVLGSAEQAKYI
jgi:fructose-bisphosphate aldolase, class II